MKCKTHYLRFSLYFLIVSLLCASPALSQSVSSADFSGTWEYQVVNTPYGDFFGNFTLSKNTESYDAKIQDREGIEYIMTILRIRGNRMTFTTNVEGTDSTFSGFFDGDNFVASGEVAGDDFTYKMEAKRKNKSISE